MAYLFVRIQLLRLKAEALNFIKILSSFERYNIVGAYADHGLVSWIACFVKSQCRLTRYDLRPINSIQNRFAESACIATHFDFILLWFEIPSHR